jgi:mRNA interferase MazF
MQIKRGEVYWVDLEPTAGSQQRGRRPCLVLTADPINARRRTIGVIPLSTSPQLAPPIIVAIPSIGSHTVAICDQLRAVDKAKFDRLVGAITAAELAAVEASVKTVFGLS